MSSSGSSAFHSSSSSAPPPSFVSCSARRSSPVRAQILEEPYFPFCAASVVVGDDPACNQRLYSVHGDGDSMLLLSYHQVCALTLALLQLVTPVPPGTTLQ